MNKDNFCNASLRSRNFAEAFLSDNNDIADTLSTGVDSQFLKSHAVMCFKIRVWIPQCGSVRVLSPRRENSDR